MSLKFPDNLLLGFASSAYQVEGGWNDQGKGEGSWDRFTHSQKEKIVDGSNGDIACDFFNKYREDVKLMKDLGTQIYRFSLSWPRILPKGLSNEVNMMGINFYKNLIDELIKNNIEPLVTLFHFDLPQTLEDLGGWTNPLLADYFCDYANVAFKYFGDKVKKWVTINEPEAYVNHSYGVGTFAPGTAMMGIAEYLGGHTLLKAHAKVYHLYDTTYRLEQRGEIGICLNSKWMEPRTDTPKDKEAAALSIQFQLGWFANPIFGEKGDYPEAMKKRIAEESKKQGYPRSRLPEFDQYWINYIKGTSDFFALNHYTTVLVSHQDSPNPPEEHLCLEQTEKDSKVILSVDPDWVGGNEWLYIVPWGFRKCLRWVKENYHNPKIYVMENGFVDGGTLEDNLRITYLHGYLTEMLKAIEEDKCRVNVYTTFSLTDNFEWQKGFTEKFGVIYIDFKDPSRKRIPKKSAGYIKNVYTKRALPENLNQYFS